MRRCCFGSVGSWSAVPSCRFFRASAATVCAAADNMTRVYAIGNVCKVAL
jgi:hypothetical protein